MVARRRLRTRKARERALCAAGSLALDVWPLSPLSRPHRRPTQTELAPLLFCFTGPRFHQPLAAQMSISSTASRSRLPPNFPPSAGPAASQQYAYQQQPQDRVPSSGSSQGGPNPSQQYQQGPAYQGSSAPSTSTQYSTYAPSSAGASVAGRDRLPSLSSATSGSASGIKPAAGSAMGDDERREIARVYWAELGDFLVDFLKRGASAGSYVMEGGAGGGLAAP
jgi:hypothetical protein